MSVYMNYPPTWRPMDFAMHYGIGVNRLNTYVMHPASGQFPTRPVQISYQIFGLSPLRPPVLHIYLNPTYKHTNIHTCTRTCVHTYIHTLIYAYIHAYIYTHIHIWSNMYLVLTSTQVVNL